MALMILATITILYGCNFYLLAHEYLKVPPVIVPIVREFSLNNLSRTNMAFVRLLQQLDRSKKANTDKVNWKEEGF